MQKCDSFSQFPQYASPFLVLLMERFRPCVSEFFCCFFSYASLMFTLKTWFAVHFVVGVVQSLVSSALIRCLTTFFLKSVTDIVFPVTNKMYYVFIKDVHS